MTEDIKHCGETLEIQTAFLKYGTDTAPCDLPQKHCGSHRGVVYERWDNDARTWTVLTIEWTRDTVKG